MKPRIGASARHGQKFSEKDVKLDETKALLAFETSDRMVHVVGRGTIEELQVLVRDAAEFAERKETWRRAYLNTPHGKAIELSAAEGYRAES